MTCTDFFSQPIALWDGYYYHPCFFEGKLWLREVKYLTLGHITNQWWNRDLGFDIQDQKLSPEYLCSERFVDYLVECLLPGWSWAPPRYSALEARSRSLSLLFCVCVSVEWLSCSSTSAHGTLPGLQRRAMWYWCGVLEVTVYQPHP